MFESTTAPSRERGSGQALAAWNDLETAAKEDWISSIGLRRGLVLHEFGGVGRASFDPVRWETSDVDVEPPSITVESRAESSFTEIGRDLQTIDLRLDDIPLTAAWSNTEAELRHQKASGSARQAVTAHLLARHSVNKLSLGVAPRQLQATPRFFDLVRAAILHHQDTPEGYSNLMTIFNHFGFYFASRVTLGGVLLSHGEARVEDSSAASREAAKFARGFEITRKGIGRTGQALRQMGGAQGTCGDYKKWRASLESVSSWAVTSYRELVPTLALIGRRDAAVGNACFHLLRKFASYREVAALQTVIDMRRYASQSKAFYQNPI